MSDGGIGSGGPSFEIPITILTDLWRAILGGIIALLAWLGKRTIGRMSDVVDRLTKLEAQLNRHEELHEMVMREHADRYEYLRRSINEMQQKLDRLQERLTFRKDDD